MINKIDGKFKIRNNHKFREFIDLIAYKELQIDSLGNDKFGVDFGTINLYGGLQIQEPYMSYAFVGSYEEIVDFCQFCAEKINKRKMHKKGRLNHVRCIQIVENENGHKVTRAIWERV